MQEIDAFTEFEEHTWRNHSNSAFVGTGYVDSTVVGRYRETSPYLQFFFRVRDIKKRISKAKAFELISKSADWDKRRILRRDAAACELAEQMAEKFCQSAVGYEDGVAWPYMLESEKDQWRALARWTLDRSARAYQRAEQTTERSHIADCLFDLSKEVQAPETARMLRKAGQIIYPSTPTK